MTNALSYFPTCSICDKSVRPETARIDERGKTVHEGCYLLKLGTPNRAARRPKRMNSQIILCCLCHKPTNVVKPSSLQTTNVAHPGCYVNLIEGKLNKLGLALDRSSAIKLKAIATRQTDTN